MAINTEKFIVEVMVELAWPSLRVKLSLGHLAKFCGGCLVCSALRTIDVPVDAGVVVLLGFPFPWGAVNTDVEDCSPTERRERK